LAASIAEFQQYLKAKVAVHIETEHKNLYPFITISREAGAGGHLLAQAILKRMEKESLPVYQGWHMLDQEICEAVLADPKMKTSLEPLLSERFNSELNDYLSQIIGGTSPQVAVYTKIFRLIMSLASVGKVVVVGRAGSFVTRLLPLGIHVRLVAEKEQRIQYMMRERDLPRDKAETTVAQLDQDRQRLVKTFFNRNAADPLEYDAVINTSRVPLESAVDALIALVKQRFEKAPAVLASKA